MSRWQFEYPVKMDRMPDEQLEGFYLFERRITPMARISIQAYFAREVCKEYFPFYQRLCTCGIFPVGVCGACDHFHQAKLECDPVPEMEE